MWQRDVPWSSAKQLRSVVETEYSMNEIFDYMLYSFGRSLITRYGLQQKKSQAFKDLVGFRVHLVHVKEADTGTRLEYRELAFPW